MLPRVTSTKTGWYIFRCHVRNIIEEIEEDYWERPKLYTKTGFESSFFFIENDYSVAKILSARLEWFELWTIIIGIL